MSTLVFLRLCITALYLCWFVDWERWFVSAGLRTEGIALVVSRDISEARLTLPER